MNINRVKSKIKQALIRNDRKREKKPTHREWFELATPKARIHRLVFDLISLAVVGKLVVWLVSLAGIRARYSFVLMFSIICFFGTSIWRAWQLKRIKVANGLSGVE